MLGKFFADSAEYLIIFLRKLRSDVDWHRSIALRATVATSRVPAKDKIQVCHDRA